MIDLLLASFLGVKTARGGNLWQPHFIEVPVFSQIREVLRELFFFSSPASVESQKSLA